MSSTGLPLRLETFLADLVDEIGLSSWKIQGNSNSTTVVLRFAGQPPSADPEHTDSELKFRRKPPSQIKRDKKRAEEYARKRQHQSKASKASTVPFLFEPIPEKNDLQTDCHDPESDTPVHDLL